MSPTPLTRVGLLYAARDAVDKATMYATSASPAAQQACESLLAIAAEYRRLAAALIEEVGY